MGSEMCIRDRNTASICPRAGPLRSAIGTVTKIYTIDMKPRPYNKTLWLLAFLLVSMPLIAGCWLGDESASRDSRPAGNASGRSAGATTSGSTPPGGARQSTPENNIQIIDVQGQPPGLQFRGKKFKLVTQNDLVNQYIPNTQTLDNWQEMFVVRRFPELSSPREAIENVVDNLIQQGTCLLYTSPSPRDLSTSRMPSSA